MAAKPPHLPPYFPTFGAVIARSRSFTEATRQSVVSFMPVAIGALFCDLVFTSTHLLDGYRGLSGG